MRKIYITEPENNPVSEEVIVLANESGADQINSGVPPILIGELALDGTVIDENTRGYVELPDPIVPEEPVDTVREDALQVIAAAQSSTNPEVAALARAVETLLNS